MLPVEAAGAVQPGGEAQVEPPVPQQSLSQPLPQHCLPRLRTRRLGRVRKAVMG